MKRNLPCQDTQQAAVSGKRSREFSPKAMDDSLKEMEGKLKDMEDSFKEMEGKLKEMESKLLGRVEQMESTQWDQTERMEEAQREHQELQEKFKLLERKLKKTGQGANKRKCYEEMEASTSRCLQLKFTSQPSRRIFTKEKVKGEEYGALKLILVDSLTGQVVSSGAESSMEVQLVLVNSEIKRSKTCNWKFKYFEGNIVVPRKGKQPLLVGDTTLSLNEGCAVVGNIKITDNSRWVPSGSFRLAAKVTNGYFDGMRVKEAITDAFVVNEDRLKAYQKHYPPFLKDEAWRLDGIAKDGAYDKRLQEKRIYTVKDFLESLQRSSDELRKFLKMPPSAWEDTVKHAQTCFLGGEMDGGWDQQGSSGCSILPNTEDMGSSGEQLPAVGVGSFDTEWTIDEIFAELEFSAAGHVASASGCLNVLTEPTAGKDEGNLKWSSLIVAMAFSVRIVAANGMEAETPCDT